MNHKFWPLAATLGATLGATAFCPRVGAQSALAPVAPPAISPRNSYVSPQWQLVQLKNVPPHFMAYWLDPKHNPVRPGSEGVMPTWATGRTAPEIGAMLSLPTGALRVTGLDEQNALWVLGNEAGVQAVREKVALLDQRIRQVEVEARCIRISDADAKSLGISFAKSDAGAKKAVEKGVIEIGMAGANIEAQIAALIARNRAQIITAPRVVAAFGQTATLSSRSETPVVFNPKDEKSLVIRQLVESGLPEQQYVVFVSTSLGLSVTPTFNSDDTVALQMGPLRTIGLSGKKLAGRSENTSDLDRITLGDLDDIPAQPIVLKDQQTAVLRGLNWGTERYRGPNQQLRTQNVIVLITPRIIRRAEDNVVAALPR